MRGKFTNVIKISFRWWFLKCKNNNFSKKYFLSVKTKVLDGRIFITGKVDNPEEKLKITKIAWETSGVRSVRNDIKIKEKWLD